MTNSFNFKVTHTLEQRQEESKKILEKFPDRIPIIVEKARNCVLNEIDKNKFLCPSDLTVGQFIYTIRKRMRLPPTTALFIFVVSNGVSKIPATSSMLGTIYAENKDVDQFLYVLYHSESTFG